MENIRQAIERARTDPRILDNLGPLPGRSRPSLIPSATTDLEFEVNPAHLLSKRIVSHNGADLRARSYDILRTQVLQSMNAAGRKIIGVTSPTPKCGKTVTAVNLALSIARQQEPSVALVDMDLQKPQIANCFGFRPEERGVLGILEEQATLRTTLIQVRTANHRLFVLPTESTKVSSELMGSRAMHNVLQDLKKDYQIVVLDLPPLLTSDDVLCVLPKIDCVLLVAAAGLSTTSEIEECMRHLESSQLVRLVLNKATEAKSPYYY
jgi:protein-tyrosine kinase